MAIRITRKRRDFDEFLHTLQIKGTAIERIAESAAPLVAEQVISVFQQGLQEEADNPRIYEFMWNRTKFDYKWNNGMVIIEIFGATEAEAGYPDRDGGPVNPSTNLWARHEFGASFDPSTGTLKFDKEEDNAGGVSVVRDGRSGGVGSPYRGMISRTINSIRPTIHAAVASLFYTTSVEAFTHTIEESSRGRIKIDPRAISALQMAGVTQEALLGLGVANVAVSDRGQILLLGRGATGAGTFIGGKDAGIPTTINT